MKEDINSGMEYFGKEKSVIYDDMIRCAIPGYEAMHDMARHMLCVKMDQGTGLLIVGAGTGREALAFAKETDWPITAVDPSEAMLAVASDKLKKENLEKRVTFHRGYVEDLAPEEAFGGATSILVMHFIPDDGSKESYLKEIGKRIKKGGRLILVDVGGEKNSRGYKEGLDVWKNYQKEHRPDPENVDKDFGSIHNEVHPVTEDRTFELLNGAGFGDIERFYQAWLLKGYAATKLW